MPLGTPSELTAGIGGSSQNITTGVITIPASTVALIDIALYDAQGSVGSYTATGSGFTAPLSIVSTLLDGTLRRHQIIAVVGNGTAATVTLTLSAGSLEDVIFSIVSFPGSDTSRGQNGVNQVTSVVGSIPSGTAINGTALSALLTQSATYMSVVGNDGFTSAIDPPTGWTELSDRIRAVDGLILENSYKLTPGETNPTANISGATGTPGYVAVLAEILDPASQPSVRLGTYERFTLRG